MDIVEFLLTCIAEDEAEARAAGSTAWAWTHGYGEMCNDPECPFGMLMQVKADDDVPSELMSVHGYDIHEPWEGGPHIARWHPARVLSECAFKRGLLNEHERLTRLARERRHGGALLQAKALRCQLVALARVYADRPGYDPTWGQSDHQSPSQRGT